MAFLECLRSTWETSVPEHSETSTVTYCGFEVTSTDKGLSICQSKYIKELLQRHPEVTESCLTPYGGWRDSFDDTEEKEESPDPAEVKMAQSLTGEALLWLVVRSRPDLAFAVTRMSQLSTKRPRDAIFIGQSVLKFLKQTPNDGLLFGPAAGTLGSRAACVGALLESFLGCLVCPRRWKVMPRHSCSLGRSTTPIGVQQADPDVSVYGRERAHQSCECCTDWSGGSCLD